MKIQLLQENLSKTLATASRFSNSKAQLPVLGNILLSTRKNKLLVASTNLEVSFSSLVPAKIEEEGEITIPGRSLFDIVSNLTPGSILLESEKEQLKLTKESFKTKLAGMNSSDFPKVIEKLPGSGLISLPSKVISDGLSKVVFATSNDITRPTLTGVLFVFGKKEIIVVGTDGFRLSQKKIKEVTELSGYNLIVPKSSLIEALRIFTGDTLSLAFDEKQKQVIFGEDENVLASSLIEGTFPDYEKIIPKSSKFQVSLDREDFLRAVKLSGVIARDSANIVKLRVLKDSLTLASESPNAGEQENSLEAKVEGELSELGEGVEVSFNFRFIEEFLSNVKDTSITLGLTDSDSPGVFLDPSDPDFLHLIMPIKIN